MAQPLNKLLFDDLDFCEIAGEIIGFDGELFTETSKDLEEFRKYCLKIAKEIRGEIRRVGIEIGSARYKAFNENTTKLDAGMIEAIWLRVSQYFTKKIRDAALLTGEEIRIPGLRQYVTHGVIPIEVLKRIDYQDDFLRRIRNRLFEKFMQFKFS